MKQISKLSALELEQEIERAKYYSEDSGPELMEALKEVERLRVIAQDVISKVATFANRPDLSSDELLDEIENIAQQYFNG